MLLGIVTFSLVLRPVKFVGTIEADIESDLVIGPTPGFDDAWHTLLCSSHDLRLQLSTRQVRAEET